MPGRIDLQLGEVRRIAVLRALSLGDMICATPALGALRRRFPLASITLVGQPWASEWVGRIGDVDEFEAFPDHPLTGQRAGTAWNDFIKRMQSRKLDLAVQLHGSGNISNGVIAQWSARHALSFHEPGAIPAHPLSMPWPTAGSESSRLLRLVYTLQADPRPGPQAPLHHPVSPKDRAAAHKLLTSHGVQPGREPSWVCIHPGAKWSSRRWPVFRFATVAQALLAKGHTVVLTGTSAEAPLVSELAARVPQAVNLCGQTDLWVLGALIDEARLLICNDTGVSHIAAARQVPSVVISCGSDVARWAPDDAVRHQVLWSAPPCRPCMNEACNQPAHLCALDVPVERVFSAIARALQTTTRAIRVI